MHKLLFIDDDQDVLFINKKHFTKQGYKVETSTNAIDAITKLRTYKADCIILDIMMPNINGYQICKKIKETSNIPCIFLSACSSEDDKVKGLLLGADDYIVKPYSLKELSARIKVQLRRNSGIPENSDLLSFPPLTLNIPLRKVYNNSDEIILSNREYDLLYLLVKKPNEVVTFEEIGKILLGEYCPSNRRAILVSACRLRKKLEGPSGLENCIQTVWSKGYLFKYPFHTP